MENTTPFLCLPVVDRVRRTLPVIGLAFVLGSIATPVGSSPLPPQTIYVQLVLRETPGFSISFPRHLYEITTSPSLKLPSQTDPLFKASPRPNQNVTVVNNTMEPGLTSCAPSIILTTRTTAYNLPSVCAILESNAYNKSSPLPPSQKSSSLTSTKEKSVVTSTSQTPAHTTTEQTFQKHSSNN